VRLAVLGVPIGSAASFVAACYVRDLLFFGATVLLYLLQTVGVLDAEFVGGPVSGVLGVAMFVLVLALVSLHRRAQELAGGG